MALSLIALTGLVLVGCSDYDFNANADAGGAGDPNIVVDPERLNFGEASASDFVVMTFDVSNNGVADLDVSNITIGGGVASFVIVTESTSFMLPSGASQPIDVAFQPLVSNDVRAQAIVESNDPDTPKIPVELVGTGRVPDIEVQPDPYDFGEKYIGCVPVTDLNIVNVGEDPVVVDGIDLADRGYTLLSVPALPFTLESNGDYQTVRVAFDPDAERDYDGELSVTSDAPGSPDVGILTGAGVHPGSYTDTWRLDEEPEVDLMFVVDQSGSMDDDQRSLASNFDRFITQLSGYTSGWQIIVVNDYDGCNNSGILTSSTPSYADKFGTAVKAGSQTEWESPDRSTGCSGEAGLYVAWMGEKMSLPGKCNDGFMRDDALLHMIVVTDEKDQSAQSWDYYVNEYQTLKGDPDLVKVSAIAGDVPGGCGTAEAATALNNAVTATGGVFLSICSDWGASVDALADASIPQTSYELSHTPNPDTIEVEVNGTKRTTGWHYDSAANHVVFDANYPEGGDSIEINYDLLPTCDQ